MISTQIAHLLALASAVVVAWRWRTAARGGQWRQWLSSLLLAAALVTFWRLVVTAVFGMVDQDWNASRLAPTFGLVYGYSLYYPATEGPILNHLYGPVAALAFLPVTIFRTPTPAVLAGGVLQDAFIFVPLLVFVRRSGMRAGADPPLVLACGLGACLLLARYRGGAYWFSMVHADGPSLALGMLACAALVPIGDTPPSTRALSASAGAVVLSLWAKQTAVVLPLALMLALWCGYGRAVALRYAVQLAVIGAVCTGIFFAWFGRPMFFNMVEVVGRHAWYRPGIAGLAAVLWSFLVSVGDVLLAGLALLALALVLARRDREPAPWARPWTAPLLAALLLLPTGALGANKIGGEPSSFHSLYYVVAGVAALLVDLGRRGPGLRLLGWVFCLLAVVAAWQSGHCSPAPRRSLWDNNEQLAYDFALRHPGEAYFPWQPLASLLAEGRLYHFEYGMMDRFMAGFDPTPEHVRAYVPPRLHWLVGRTPLWTFSHFFPEYSEQTKLPELPGWIVRTRPAA